MRSLPLFLFGLFAVVIVLLVVGLYTIPLAGDPQFAQEPAGFWYGVWHGMTAPIVFIMSLFGSNHGIYECSNTGGWYNFGFLMGISSAVGGSSSSASRRRKDA